MNVLKRVLCCCRARGSRHGDKEDCYRINACYKLHTIRDNSIATPYEDDPADFIDEDREESPASPVTVEGPAAVWSASPISTRARITYGLDRYPEKSYRHGYKKCYKLYTIRDNSIAIPYENAAAYFIHEDREESPASPVTVEGPAAVWSASPISTRARITYGLDSYKIETMEFLRCLCCRPKEYDVPIGYGDGRIILGGGGSVAVPYNDSKKKPIAPASPIWDDGDSVQEEAPQEQQGGRTSRARFTYGVERYTSKTSLPRDKKRKKLYTIHDNSFTTPYKDDPADFIDEVCEESPASPVTVEGPAAVWSASLISTRARITYGLDRFERNALLILAQTEPQGRPYVDQRVELLSRSFGAFRFDVETHVDLDLRQMEARLEEFFSQDFSRVGAVCVAVVGGTGEAGQLPARAQHCQESRVLRHLTDELPSSLVGRPRIYITEMARSGPAADSGAYSLPITIRFPDVIAVHIPIIIEGELNPLQMLCARLGTERDFRAEVMAAAHAAETAFPALEGRPIQVDSTLYLDLDLVMAESEPDANGTTESLPVGANGTTENLPNGANGTSENLPDGTNGTSA